MKKFVRLKSIPEQDVGNLEKSEYYEMLKVVSSKKFSSGKGILIEGELKHALIDSSFFE